MRGGRMLVCLALGVTVALGGGRPAPGRQEVPLVPIPPPPLSGPKEKAVPARPAALPRPGAVVTAPQLVEAARARYAGIDSYIVRLTRREQVKDRLNPEEVLLFKFRKEPWSVYLKWLGKEGQGREVVYVRGKHEGKIHTLLAAGDIPFLPAGRRMALLPDNPLVRSACRHPITQVGIGASIDRLAALLAAQERGDRKLGSVAVVPRVERAEFDRPVSAVEHTLPPGFDPTLPRGGRRTYFFDPDSGLPTLISTRDDRNQEVEYYRYDRLQPSVKLDDADFDPERLWGKPAGPRPEGR